MSDAPKILFLDIETLPNIGFCWGKWDQNILSFKQQTCIATFSAKWSDGNVFAKMLPDYKGYKTGSYDDKALVADLWKLLDEADITIAHNGKDFDFRVIAGRFLFHGLKPPSPYKIVDTKLISKRVARFNSNALNDLGQLFGFGKKIKTDFDLWLGCINGNMDCWRRMVKYNKQDVVLLEKVYQRFLPFIIDHPNRGLITGKERACPKCGSTKLKSWGLSHNSTRSYRKLRCLNCGGWTREVVSTGKTKTTNCS
jgi:hypothetical protein